MNNRDTGVSLRLLKFPDNFHSFGPECQVLESDFAEIAVNDLLRDPGNRNEITIRRHLYDIPFRTPLEVVNVAVMRQERWPQLEIRRGFKDPFFRGSHIDRVRLVHGVKRRVRGGLESARSTHRRPPGLSGGRRGHKPGWKAGMLPAVPGDQERNVRRIAWPQQ